MNINLFGQDTSTQRDSIKGTDLSFNAKKQRETVTVELRKQKHNEFVQKKRKQDVSTTFDVKSQVIDSIAEKGLQNMVSQWVSDIKVDSKRLETVSKISQMVSLNNRSEEFSFRVDLIIQSGLLNALVLCLTLQDEKLQRQASLAICNITGGNTKQTSAVVSSGAVKHLVALLASKNSIIVSDALYALSNIAGDNSRSSWDELHRCNIVDGLKYVCSNTQDLSIIDDVIDCFANLSKSAKQHNKFLRPFLPTLKSMFNINNEKVLKHTCCALKELSHQSENTNDLACIIPNLLALVNQNTPHDIVNSIVIALVNLTHGEGIPKYVFETKDLSAKLLILLNHSNIMIVANTCILISNVVVESPLNDHKFIQYLTNGNVIGLMITKLKSAPESVKKEVCRALMDTIDNSDDKQIQAIVGLGIIPALCGIIKGEHTDVTTVTDALDTLYTLVKKQKAYADRMEECDVSQSLSKHMDSKNSVISNMASKLSDYMSHHEEKSAFSINSNKDQKSFFGGNTDKKVSFTYPETRFDGGKTNTITNYFQPTSSSSQSSFSAFSSPTFFSSPPPQQSSFGFKF